VLHSPQHPCGWVAARVGCLVTPLLYWLAPPGRMTHGAICRLFPLCHPYLSLNLIVNILRVGGFASFGGHWFSGRLDFDRNLTRCKILGNDPSERMLAPGDSR
jgi:hypothetical protein